MTLIPIRKWFSHSIFCMTSIVPSIVRDRIILGSSILLSPNLSYIKEARFGHMKQTVEQLLNYSNVKTI